MKLQLNENGVQVSCHVCIECGNEFTICPPAEWGDKHGCMAPECDSYRPECDADVLFGDFSGLNRHCEITGKDICEIGSIGPQGRLGRS